jgi:hypothetical protein
MVTVGEGLWRAIFNDAYSRKLHALLLAYPLHEGKKMIGQFLRLDPRHRIEPAQTDVHQPWSQRELQNAEDQTDPHRNVAGDVAKLGDGDQDQRQ